MIETLQHLITDAVPETRYHELMQPKFTIAHKFDGDEAYQLWTMRFDSAAEAADWIRTNHPESYRTNEWVVLEYPAGIMM